MHAVRSLSAVWTLDCPAARLREKKKKEEEREEREEKIKMVRVVPECDCAAEML